MKKSAGWCFALALIALAGGLAAPAAAIPEDPPNDNVCICHQTQYNRDEPNDNQKGVIICVDPNSVPFEKHTKHGDQCVAGLTDDPSGVCGGVFISEAECLGEVCGPDHDFEGIGDQCCPAEPDGCGEFTTEGDCLAECFPE